MKIVPIVTVGCLLVSVLSVANAAQAPVFSHKTNLSKDYLFMKDLVRDLGKDGFKCINYLKNKDVQGVREEGTCSFEHNQITIDLFSDAKTAKSTFNIMKSMMSGYSLGSNNWIITLDDAALSKSISKGLRLKILS